MTTRVPARRRNLEFRSKVKTGCATCRIRKIKCDEQKPFCKKCVNTGRTCDGYESPFRHVNHPPINNAPARSIWSEIDFQTTQCTLSEIADQDIELLSRYLSTKTMFDVKVGCDEEARQILQAGLTDPAIRHAILSLKALREDIETSGDSLAPVAEQTENYRYGLQQYGMALKSLASKLSFPNPGDVKLALLCCQILISIEQLRKNHAAMAQHVIRGLRIMHEYRARPSLTADGTLLPAHEDQLPLLDVFVIKLFVAPCGFADPPPGTTTGSPQEQTAEAREFRAIAPNTRTELTKIGNSVLEFLGKVSKVDTSEAALELLPEKAALLNSLQSWLDDLELVLKQIGSSGPGPINVCFLRYFHRIMKIILLGTLDSSPELDMVLHTESDQLQAIASNVGERVKNYSMCSGTAIARGKSSSVPR